MVNRPVPSKEYPEREGFREHQPERCRKVSHPDEMINLVEAQNERLTRAGHVKMIFEEFVAGRLYTGPMYHKYNTVLRGLTDPKPKGEMATKLHTLCRGNTYSTTLHVINSAVLKMSRLSEIGRVERPDNQRARQHQAGGHKTIRSPSHHIPPGKRRIA